MRHGAAFGVFAILALAVASCDRFGRGPANIAERVAAAVPVVEGATGMKFKTPPRAETRTREAVRGFLLRAVNAPQAQEQIRTEEIAFKLFGLIPESLDVRRFYVELLTEQVMGYYDPESHVLYVADDVPEEYLTITVNHELIHALQDQYLNLDSVQKAPGNSDQKMAAQAVLEGHAAFKSIEIAAGGSLAARLPGGWEQTREIIREQQAAYPKFAAAPMVVQEAALFPYLSGAEFLRRFETRQERSSPFESMPVSTEQILSEAAYFDSPRDMPTDVILPGPKRAGEYEETLGEFGTRLLLFQHHRDNVAAVGAAHGWDGDRYRVVRAGNGRGIVWVSVWDTPTDAAQFVDVLGLAIGKRYRTSAPQVATNGVRRYAGSGRLVVITPREIRGRSVVVYADVPAGASPDLIDPARISLGRQ